VYGRDDRYDGREDDVLVPVDVAIEVIVTRLDEELDCEFEESVGGVEDVDEDEEVVELEAVPSA